MLSLCPLPGLLVPYNMPLMFENTQVFQICKSSDAGDCDFPSASFQLGGGFHKFGASGFVSSALGVQVASSPSIPILK